MWKLALLKNLVLLKELPILREGQYFFSYLCFIRDTFLSIIKIFVIFCRYYSKYGIGPVRTQIFIY